MPDFRLRDPDGNEYVTGDASERARLLGQGYTDVDDSDDGGDEATTPDTATVKRTQSKSATQAPTDAGK